MSSTLINFGLILFVIITWGYTWVLMKESLNFMGPLTFVGFRFLIAAITLVPISLWKERSRTVNYKFPDYFLVGIFQTVATFGLVIFGLKYVTAGKSSVFLYTMPVWTAFLVHFLLGEKLGLSKWTGVFIGFTGIFFIMGWDTISTQSMNVIFGEMLIIGAAISWAIANIIMKHRLVGQKPYTVTGFQTLFGSIILVILATVFEGFLNIRVTPYSVYILLFSGVISSAVNFSIWFYLIGNMDINIPTFSSMLVPVFGLTFDWLLLGTRLDIGVIVGGVLILFGIYRVSKS